jgi:hypothetical protein
VIERCATASWSNRKNVHPGEILLGQFLLEQARKLIDEALKNGEKVAAQGKCVAP